jgi:hypothetical protein
VPPYTLFFVLLPGGTHTRDKKCIDPKLERPTSIRKGSLTATVMQFLFFISGTHKKGIKKMHQQKREATTTTSGLRPKKIFCVLVYCPTK